MSDQPGQQPNYGTPPQQQPNYGFTPGPGPGVPQQAPQGNGMAVAGLVLGIIALVLCWVPFLNWLLALLGIIFGAVGMSKAKKVGGKGKGLAIAGLICGILGAILGTAIVILAMQAARHARYNYNSYGMMTPATHVTAQTPDRLS